MSQYSDLVIADGATAYWRLGETSGTTAVDVIGGANGTISGGVTLGQAGALADGDKAMAFDGVNGKVRTAALALATTCSVECWAKTSFIGNYESIVSSRGATSSGTEILLYNQTGVFGVYIGGALQAGSISDNVWHYLVWTSDGSTSRIYIDGVLVNTGAQIRTAGQMAWNFAWDRDNGYVPEALDEVAIYPTALTPAQIQAHYEARLAVSGSVPVSKAVSVGVVTNLVQSEIYALSPKIRHVTSSAAIEVSNDGVAFSPLVGAETVGASTRSLYVRTSSPTCALIGKG